MNTYLAEYSKFGEYMGFFTLWTMFSALCGFGASILSYQNRSVKLSIVGANWEPNSATKRRVCIVHMQHRDATCMELVMYGCKLKFMYSKHLNGL